MKNCANFFDTKFLSIETKPSKNMVVCVKLDCTMSLVLVSDHSIIN